MSRTARRIGLLAAAVGLGAAVTTGQLPANAATTVTIDSGTTFQWIDGFGISEAFNQANSIRNANSTTQKQALDLLFTVTPFLTNNTNSMAAQAAIPLNNGTFSATVPARSLVTYRITH